MCCSLCFVGMGWSGRIVSSAQPAPPTPTLRDGCLSRAFSFMFATLVARKRTLATWFAPIHLLRAARFCSFFWLQDLAARTAGQAKGQCVRSLCPAHPSGNLLGAIDPPS